MEDIIVCGPLQFLLTKQLPLHLLWKTIQVYRAYPVLAALRNL